VSVSVKNMHNIEKTPMRNLLGSLVNYKYTEHRKRHHLLQNGDHPGELSEFGFTVVVSCREESHPLGVMPAASLTL
jgi:hypothetical protein